MTNKAQAACKNRTGQPLSVVIPVGLIATIGVALGGFWLSSVASGKSQGEFKGSITARVTVLEEHDKRIDGKLDGLQKTLNEFGSDMQRDIGEIKGALGIKDSNR